MFTAPAPTWRLVTWKMLIGSVTAALLFVLATTILNLALDAKFPVLGPAFYFAAMYCCVMAGLWSLGDFRIGKVIAWWLVVASFVFSSDMPKFLI